MRLFGDDIFISYAHRDAGEYALALLARLSKRYAVYVDRVGSTAGEQISAKVIRHLKGASMLIVIVSEDATREDSKVREEVELFAKTKRPILVIDAGGAVARCKWEKSLTGLSIAKESPESFEKHRPSPGVRRSVEQTRKYWTRTNRLLAIAAAIIIVTIGSVVWSQQEVEIAGRAADAARASAEANTREAARQRIVASSLRLANLATAAWQQEKTPVDDVLLMVAESLRRGATPSALELAAVARALRPQFVSRHPIDLEQFSEQHNDRTLVLHQENSKVVRFVDLSTGRERHANIRCDDALLDSMTPTAVAVRCLDGEKQRGFLIDLRTLAITNTEVPGGTGDTIAGLVAGGRLVDAARVADSSFELRDRKSGARIGDSFTVGGNSTGTHPFIHLLRFSDDGQVLAVAAANDLTRPNAGGDVWLFEAPTGKPRGHLILADAADEIALNHDGSAVAIMSGTLWAGLRSGTVVMALRNGETELKPAWRMPFRRSGEASLAFVGDAVMFVDGNVIRIVAAGERGEARELRRIVEEELPHFATVLADGDVVTATTSHVTRWNAGVIPSAGGDVAGIDPTTRRIVFWRERTAVVRDLVTGADLFRREFPRVGEGGASGENGDARGPVALDAGGRHLTIGFPMHVHTYDVRTGRTLPDRYPDTTRVAGAVAYAANGALVTEAHSWGPQGYFRVRITVVDSAGKLMDDFSAPDAVRNLSPSADAHWMSFTAGGAVYLRDAVAHKTLKIADRPGTTLLSPDGSLLTIANERGHVEVRDLGRHRTVAAFDVDEPVMQICLSDDRRHIGLFCDSSRRVLLYDLTARQITFDAPMQTRLIAFQPGEPTLMVIGPAGDVATVDDDPLRVARAICKEVGHSLSPERWSQLIGREKFVDTCAELSNPPRSSPAVR